MRRWNGWGQTTVTYPVPEVAVQFLSQRLGAGTPVPDVSLQEIAGRVPESRLPEHPLVSTRSDDRVRHACGQSLPDWIALRSGQISTFPDGIAYPMTAEDVRALLRFARETGVHIIPYGGGTSVVGHINPLSGDQPVLTIDMSRLNRLETLDETSCLASFGAGVTGPDLEAHLRAHGYTLGHFPQSFEHSTLGGWVAARSSGQQSLHYGRIEDLFTGGTVETPQGTLTLPSFPASAAGPDLRHLVLGSEGRMGIISSATVRITPLPQQEVFRTVFFRDFVSGLEAVRALVQERLPLSMLRLSTAAETETTLRLAGHPHAVTVLERLLATRGAGEQKCMLVFGATGSHTRVRQALRAASTVIRRYSGVQIAGQYLGAQWRHSRFRTPYLRNTLWEIGYAIDTMETAVTWDRVPAALEAIERAITTAASVQNTAVHVFTHVSHVYRHGASLYTTLVFRVLPDPDAMLSLWGDLKRAGSAAIVQHGGTISHQHGVGIDHAPYLQEEKGALGLRTLRAVFRQFDPNGIMNPGKLVREEEG